MQYIEFLINKIQWAKVQANFPEWCNYTITTMAEMERVVAV